MGKTTLKALLLAATAIALCSGCWDSVDINDRNILTAVVVDRTDFGYAYYVEIPALTGGSREAATQNNVTIVKAEGRNSLEARDNLDKMMDRPIFLGAVQTVVFTDNAASYGIEEYLLRLRQDHDYRKTAHVVVTTDDPMKLLSDKPENDVSVGFAINDTLMSLVHEGKLHHTTLMDTLESLSASYKHFIVPTIAMVNNNLAFTGFTVFSGGIKTGFIPASDTKSICLLLAKRPKMEFMVPYKDTFAAMEVALVKKRITPHYSEGRPSFDMALRFKATLLYPEHNKPVTETDLDEIKRTLQAMLTKEFTDTFIKSQQEYKFDCFELHTPFRIAFPAEYKLMDWASEYQKAALYLSISVDIISTDSISYEL